MAQEYQKEKEKDHIASYMATFTARLKKQSNLVSRVNEPEADLAVTHIDNTIDIIKNGYQVITFEDPCYVRDSTDDITLVDDDKTKADKGKKLKKKDKNANDIVTDAIETLPILIIQIQGIFDPVELDVSQIVTEIQLAIDQLKLIK